jgi:zinc transport system permease protein
VTLELILMSSVMAVASGVTGCFAVMRRMSLAADALSHVALPGIGIALALHLNPLIGAVAMLAFGALLVWAVEEQTRAPIETIIGVMFAAALAVGAMVTRGEDLMEALFGGVPSIGAADGWFGLAAAIAVVAFVVTQRHRLVVALVSPDLARTTGINVRLLNLIYLEVFALTIALGLRYLGVLLMGSLLVIPAATARRVSRNLSEMLVVAAVLAVVSTIGGTYAAEVIGQPSGPVIVTLAALMFVVSLGLRPNT